jgi:hypothetical protein
MSERDLEAPDEDVVEQSTPTLDTDEEAEPEADPPPVESLEVDPADHAEQERTVPLEEDEYR